MTSTRDDAEIRRLILNRYHFDQSIQSRTDCSPGRRLSQSRNRVSPKRHGHLALQKERLLDEDNVRTYHLIEINDRSSCRRAPSSRKRQLQHQLLDRNAPQSVVRSVTAAGDSDINEENNPSPILPLWCKSDRYASLHCPHSRPHGINSEEARHITYNQTKNIETRAPRRSSSTQFRTSDDMTTHTLAPRFDVWIAFTISSCATTLNLIWILLDSRMFYDDDVPHFTAMDALSLLTCSLSFLFGAVITCGVHFTPFRIDVTKSIFKTIDWGDFEEYRGHYRRDAFIGSMNLTAEWIALSILFFLWIVSIPFIVERDEYHYSIMDGIEGEMSGETLWKDNLFYSSWISLLLCAYLWVEVCTLSDRSGTIKLAELRHLPTNTFTKRWTLFLFVALVVFIASVATYTGPMCQGSLLKSTSYCSNLLTGIVMGGLFQLFLFLGVAVLYRLSNMHRRDTVDERIVSVWLRDLMSSFAALSSIVVQGFTVALLTSSTGGPANASETLYFGSWVGFFLSIEVCMRYSELRNTSDTFVKAGRNSERGMNDEDKTVNEGDEYEDDDNYYIALKKDRDNERRNNKAGLVEDVNIPKQKQKSFVFPTTVSMIPIHQQVVEIDKSFTTFTCNSTPLRPLTIERYVVPPTKLSTASKGKNNNDIWRKGTPSATAEQQSMTESVIEQCSTMKVKKFRRPISPLTSDDSSTRIRQILLEVDSPEMNKPTPPDNVPQFSAATSSNNYYVGSSRRLLYQNTTSGMPLLSVATKSLALNPSQGRRKGFDSSSSTKHISDKSVDVIMKANRELLVSTAELLNSRSPPPIQRTQPTWSPISSMSSRPSSILMSSNESSLHEDRDGEKTKKIVLLMRSASVRQGANTPTIDSHSKPW